MQKKSKKNLNDPDNHNGVITHLESDMTEATQHAHTPYIKYVKQSNSLKHRIVLPETTGRGDTELFFNGY